MCDSFNDFQKRLVEKALPESIGLLPKESYDAEMLASLKDITSASLSAIAADNDLLSFITDTIGVPMETDLPAMEALLRRYKAVTGDFFKDEAPRQPTDGFRTAAGTPVGEKAAAKEKSSDCNVDEYIIERIKMEILESNLNVCWEDIVGLGDVKKTINEIVLWPMQRPDIFTGLRGPPKGLLLFGPPGTGKTMIGKCIASQCKATFFSISASSLTSKWVGEGEKMVRALFYLARKMAPSVIFIDEIDSLLSQRSDNENEGSRRIKTEFLVQFDGAAVSDSDRILIIGATNRPHEIDEAARRRLVKRIYVPLPEAENRMQMVRHLIRDYANNISEEGLAAIAASTDGYSGSDMFNLCREATLEPLREIEDINNFRVEDMRRICVEDFQRAMRQIRKSVSAKDLEGYSQWNANFGSMPK